MLCCVAQLAHQQSIPSSIDFVISLVCLLPSGELTWQWKITIVHGKIHYKWPFSIAMLVHQRVTTFGSCVHHCISTMTSLKKWHDHIGRFHG